MIKLTKVIYDVHEGKARLRTWSNELKAPLTDITDTYEGRQFLGVIKESNQIITDRLHPIRYGVLGYYMDDIAAKVVCTLNELSELYLISHE